MAKCLSATGQGVLQSWPQRTVSAWVCNSGQRKPKTPTAWETAQEGFKSEACLGRVPVSAFTQHVLLNLLFLQRFVQSFPQVWCHSGDEAPVGDVGRAGGNPALLPTGGHAIACLCQNRPFPPQLGSAWKKQDSCGTAP